jgi:hypothetical protein
LNGLRLLGVGGLRLRGLGSRRALGLRGLIRFVLMIGGLGRRLVRHLED